LPRDADRYRFEAKLDGFRAQLEVSRGEVVGLWSKRGNSMLGQYPVIQQVPPSLRKRSVLLDGELVGFDDKGRPRFQRIQLGHNVVFYAFDVLGIGQKLVIDERYDARRRRLEQLNINAERWRTVDAFDAVDGPVLFAATREQGLDGVVSKRRDSRYECGLETGAWIKTVHRREETFFVGGWLPASNDESEVGSLLIGEFDRDGRLIYRGRVAGFDDEERRAMREVFTPARLKHNPFEVGQVPPAARFLAPKIRVDVKYREITADGQLRHPVFVDFHRDGNTKTE
jgi:bifunctional non-homologous end joining protein LigD